MNALHADALAMLHRYSITYVRPVEAMPPGLREVMLAAYLIMRGIDEIEDHPTLDLVTKTFLLEGIGSAIEGRFDHSAMNALFAGRETSLPEVSLRLADWAALPPEDIAARVLEAFACMATRMAAWARRDFRIENGIDLDRYTYAVAGSLALLFGDIWAWFDGTRCNRAWLLGYGRGIQAANILKDRGEDLERGASFWPPGWEPRHLRAYAERELRLGDQLLVSLPAASPARRWCELPLANAWNIVHASETARPEQAHAGAAS